MGKEPPESENPVPETVAELIVSAAVPVDRTDTAWVLGLPIFTLPKASVVGLTDIWAVAAVNCSEKLLLTLPAEAVRVTVCVVLTVEAVAVNEALVAPAGTVTEAGTETELLLLASATASPPEPAAPDSETEHASVTDPVKELLLQVSPLRAAATVGAAPVPESATVVVLPAAALLVIVRVPLTVPVAVGANATCSAAV